MPAEMRTDLGIIANRRLGCDRAALESAMYGDDGYPGAYFGESQDHAAERTGVSRTAISRVLAAPHIYDPFIDEVALDRALSGQWPTIHRLTVWERELFKDAIADWSAGDDEGFRVFGGPWRKLVRWVAVTRR